jgi:serine/threonine-protein kinase RIO1
VAARPPATEKPVSTSPRTGDVNASSLNEPHTASASPLHAAQNIKERGLSSDSDQPPAIEVCTVSPDQPGLAAMSPLKASDVALLPSCATSSSSNRRGSRSGFSGSVSMLEPLEDDDAQSDCGSAASFRPKGFRAPRVHNSANIIDDDTGYQSVNQYLLIEIIGEGAYGQVFKAHDDQTGQCVAVKVIPRQRFRHASPISSTSQSPIATQLLEGELPAMGESVLREIAIMKKLANKHIVSMLGAIDDPRRRNIYLVMEYMAGGNMLTSTEEHDAWAKNQFRGPPPKRLYEPLEEFQARSYVRHIVSGMTYLHNKEIVHCDIKPENLLVSESKVVRIADFGVSELVERITLSNFGTPAFCAPELLTALPAKPTKAGQTGHLGVGRDDVRDADRRASVRRDVKRIPVQRHPQPRDRFPG